MPPLVTEVHVPMERTFSPFILAQVGIQGDGQRLGAPATGSPRRTRRGVPLAGANGKFVRRGLLYSRGYVAQPTNRWARRFALAEGDPRQVRRK